MVADRDRLVAFLFWLVPTGYKAEAEVLEEAVARSFGGFIRGQVVTGLAFGGDLPRSQASSSGSTSRPSRPRWPAC